MQFKLLGATQHPVVVGEDLQPGRVNYFIGRDPAKWKRNIPTYARVRYKSVYPGIDLVYYGNHRQLEYDFAISPGADPGQIQFEIQGARQIRIDSAGDLVLDTAGGTLHFQTPVVYQESGGVRAPVKGSYVVNNSSSVAFRVGQYDSSKPLVIDPVLVYSTYLGGSGNEQPAGIAVDKTGSVYIAGSTDSTNFPLATLGSLPSGTTHVFVAKLDPTGSSLVYADYIGGMGPEFGYALALDGANDLYITGATESTDFPVVNAYQSSLPGGHNGFVTKISPDGSSLLYSTYLGGNNWDQPSSIGIDSTGKVYVAGITASLNFPVANAYQPTVSPNQAGMYGIYGFLTKFSSDGSSLVYSTFLGGNSNVTQICGPNPCWPAPFSLINGIAVDSNGNAYVTGNTNTYNFPATPGAYLTTDSAPRDAMIGFVSKFSSSGTLDYSTYLYGASGAAVQIASIAVDGSGSAYVTGTAPSDGTFPITSTSICDPTASLGGCSYAFVTKFDPTGSTLLYSTFLGLYNFAFPQAVILDQNNDAYVLCLTYGTSFGIPNGIEPYSSGADLLVAEVDPIASTELFATYLGGSGDEYPAGIALDSSGNLYVAGATDSVDFPVTPGAFQSTPGGNGDAFVLKIGPASAPSVTVAPGLLQYPVQPVGMVSQPQTVVLRNMGSASLSIASITTTGDFAETDDCTTGVPAAGSCTFSITFTPTAPGVRNGAAVIQDDAAGSPHTISLSGTGFGPGVSLAPTSLAFQSQPIGTPSTAQTVALTNSGNAPLTISGVQVAGDYAQTNNCPASLAGGAGCTISITFTPTLVGTRTGTLTVTDNAAGSPQSVNLSGTGSDFSLGGSPSGRTVKAGSSAAYTLTISPLGGSFAGTVRLTCGGLPTKTSCTFSPSTLTPGGNSATSTLSITTTGPSAQTAAAGAAGAAPAIPMHAVWIQLSGFAMLGILLAVPKGSGRKRVGILFGMALIFMLGCGGTGIVPVPKPGTPPGTYTVTVTGTSGGLQHSLPLSLTVQ